MKERKRDFKGERVENEKPRREKQEIKDEKENKTEKELAGFLLDVTETKRE